jgi:hypothetical protein
MLRRAADAIGTLLVLDGAVLLAVSLWLPWFEAALPCPQIVGAPCEPRRFDAWDSFQQADLALALLAAGAVVAALAGPPLAARLAPALGVATGLGQAVAGVVVAAFGWTAIAVTLFAIDRPIPVVPVEGRIPGWGFFLALLGAGAIVGGGWWTVVRHHRAEG